MKYIITKDGRTYKTRKCYPEETLFDNVTYVYSHEFIKNKDIIKQADTIEELCDEFVVLGYFAYQDLPVLIKSSNKQQEINIAKNMKNENNKVYGAIWTDKGLIYVAKINDKGELELL